MTALAAHFLHDPAKRGEFRSQARNAVGDRQKPLLLVAADYDSEKTRIAELIRTRLARQEAIGILFPQKRLVYGYAKGLRVSRAVKWACLSTSEGRMISLVQQLADGTTLDYVEVQRLAQGGVVPMADTIEVTDEDELPF